MKLHVIGTGEAFDTGLGNCSYLLESDRFPCVLFDCGYQVPERVWTSEPARRGQAIDAVCLTHLHADHSFGMVPLLVRFVEEKRRAPLVVLGPRGTERFLSRLLDLGYPGLRKRIPFPIRYQELSAGKTLRWRGLKWRCARTDHSVLNHSIRVDAARVSFAVSGDGRMTSESRKLVEGVDLLLQEVYWLDLVASGHTCLEELKRFSRTASFGRIGVAHHSRSDKRKIRQAVTALSKKDPRWIALDPGMTLTLK